MAKQTSLNIILLLIASIITYLIISHTIKAASSTEPFCDTSGCSVCTCNGIGQKICRNRNNKIVSYNMGMTENTIPPNGIARGFYAPFL